MNSSLNNFNETVEIIKINLPSNINNMVRKMKPQILQKIFNKLKNSPSNKRNSGFMNQNDITFMNKNLNNFV